MRSSRHNTVSGTVIGTVLQIGNLDGTIVLGNAGYDYGKAPRTLAKDTSDAPSLAPSYLLDARRADRTAGYATKRSDQPDEGDHVLAWATTS